jgi:hypothetical protein
MNSLGREPQDEGRKKKLNAVERRQIPHGNSFRSRRCPVCRPSRALSCMSLLPPGLTPRAKGLSPLRGSLTTLTTASDSCLRT